MIRISPSLIDSYRYWRTTDFEYPDRERASLEELLSAIRGEPREPTEAMARGLAWHQALEEEVQEEQDTLEIHTKGHLFRFSAAEVALLRQQLPALGNRELRGRLELPEAGAVMYLRTDGIAGNIIHEHKTTGRIDVDRYTATSQWRAYLLAFECKQVVYHVVRLYKNRRENLWQVKEYLPFSQYAYPRMREDLVADAAELCAFIRQQNLESYRGDNGNAADF